MTCAMEHQYVPRASWLAQTVGPHVTYLAEFGADSGEKHEPVSDIDTVSKGSLKALDPMYGPAVRCKKISSSWR
jgi:hypothetical protein